MLRIYLFPIVIMLYIFATLFPNPVLLYIVGFFANLAVFVSVFYARGLYLLSGLIFYLIGFFLFLNNDLPWHHFFLQFDSMLGILALFLFLPFLNSLILVGRYDKHLSTLLQYNVNHVGDLYKRGFIVSYILGLFLNIATIPLLLQSLSNSLKSYARKVTDKFYTKSLLRAYALCLMWSPMEIMVIKTLELTRKDYLFVFPFLFIFALVVLLIDTFIGKKKYEALPITGEKITVSLDTIYQNIKDLLLLLLFLVITVTILNYILQKGYLFSLVLMIVPISLIWAFRIRKVKRYLVHSVANWKEKTNGLANFFFMFLSAGFFVSMVAETKMLTFLQQIFIQFSGQVFILFCLVALYFFTTSYIGFHPLVSIVLFAEILRPISIEVSSIAFSVVLITCSLSTVMYSPFNLSISILSSELGSNPFRVGLWNLPFALLFIAISIIFAYTIYLIGEAFI